MRTRSYALLTLALMGAAAVIAVAGEIGNPNAYVASGNLGIGTAFPARPLAIRASAQPQHALAILNQANTAEVMTATVTSAGGGQLNIQNSLNQNKIHFAPGESSFILDAGFYLMGGNLGIGTSLPARPLTVRASAATQHVISIQNQTNTAEIVTMTVFPNGGQINLQNSSNVNKVRLAADGTASYLLAGSLGIGTAAPATALDVTGEISCNVINVRGADLSEGFAVRAAQPDQIKPGMVVSIDPEHVGALLVSREGYDRKVAGILSGAGDIPVGVRMNRGADKAGQATQPVAMAGRVYCWADASHGAIRPGDLLTSSPTPGHAMRVKDFAKAQGATLGKAMSGLAQGRGLVLVLVNLQ